MTSFDLILRVSQHFSAGTPWVVVGASSQKVMLRWDGDGFNHEAQKDRAKVPGMKLIVHAGGTATAKIGNWVADQV